MTGPAPIPLPPQLTYGSILWNVIALDTDTQDGDALPDVVPINGTATVTARVTGGAILAQELPMPLTILTRGMELLIKNGRLQDKDNHTLVKLLACDSPGLSQLEWSYHIDYALDDGYTFGGFDFKLHTDEELDLTLVIPLAEPSPGVIITKGDKGDQGDAGTMQIVDVNTLPPGSDAAVRNVGTAENALLEIDIPRGMPGTGSVVSVEGLFPDANGNVEIGTPDATGGEVVKRNEFGDVSLGAAYTWRATAQHSPPTDPDELTRKDYVDALGTALPTANTVVRRDASGNTAIDAVTLTDAPTVAGHGTRKDYVDGQVATRIPTSDKGAVNGVASLGSDGKLTAAQLPDLAVSDFLGTVASQTAMLALVGQKGDWAIRSDTGTVWIISGNTPSQLASWTQVAYPAAPVSSVAGRTGAVTLAIADVTGLSSDAAAATASLRTLGTGATQAAAGNHGHAGLTADQAAATASVRTLGTGAQQAAAGNHRHRIAAVAVPLGTNWVRYDTSRQTLRVWGVDGTAFLAGAIRNPNARASVDELIVPVGGIPVALRPLAADGWMSGMAIIEGSTPRRIEVMTDGSVSMALPAGGYAAGQLLSINLAWPYE